MFLGPQYSRRHSARICLGKCENSDRSRCPTYLVSKGSSRRVVSCSPWGYSIPLDDKATNSTITKT